MSDNTPEEKPATTAATPTPQERLDAARKAREAADAEYRAAFYAVPLPPRDYDFGNSGGGSDDDDDDGDEVSDAMFETATELAAEPWGNDELRLRAIVFLTRSAIKVRENHVAQMNREDEIEHKRDREESKEYGLRRR